MEILDISEKADDKKADDPDAESKDVVDEPEKKAEPAEKAKPAIKSAEDTAREGGWKPQEEWDGDPAEWRSAELFNERGIWIGKHKQQEQRLRDIETNFDARLTNVTKLHNVALETQKKALILKRDDAIDLADKETANKIQDDIDKLQPAEEVAAVIPGKQAVDDWNTANTWISGPTPKAAYARAQFQAYEGQGLGVEQAIASMEADVAREFPAINHKRNDEAIPEKGSPPGHHKPSPTKLSMGDLTSDERKFRQAMPGAWKNDAEFLQAVQDSRSADNEQ